MCQEAAPSRGEACASPQMGLHLVGKPKLQPQEVRSTDGSVDHRWHEDRMSVLLAQHDAGSVFVSGCVSNQGKFYDDSTPSSC